MKKTTLLSACLLAGTALADIDIEYNNNGTAIAQTDGATPVDQALFQLIWSSTSPVAQAGADATLGSGEFLLSDYLTSSGTAGTFDPKTTTTYYDSNVGGNDVNNGYFFVRVFDNAEKAEGAWYLQFNLAGSNLTEYDVEPRPTQYITGNMIDDVVGGSGQFIPLNDASFGHQAIPEPAVAGLIMIFGTGLIVARRMFSKEA